MSRIRVPKGNATLSEFRDVAIFLSGLIAGHWVSPLHSRNSNFTRKYGTSGALGISTVVCFV
jgi:hypothetical protein